MEENLIRKGGFSTDGDITIEITPLSPVRHPFFCFFAIFAAFGNFCMFSPKKVLNSGMRNASASAKKEQMERMVALELEFENLDMSAN